MDNYLLQYINDTFLSNVCDSSTISSSILGLSETNWQCPCDITGIDNMPEIQLKLKNEDLFYKFDPREYFFYPYYNLPTTLPGSCQLSFAKVTENNKQVLNSFIFG